MICIDLLRATLVGGVYSATNNSARTCICWNWMMRLGRAARRMCSVRRFPTLSLPLSVLLDSLYLSLSLYITSLSPSPSRFPFIFFLSLFLPLWLSLPLSMPLPFSLSSLCIISSFPSLLHACFCIAVNLSACHCGPSTSTIVCLSVCVGSNLDRVCVCVCMRRCHLFYDYVWLSTRDHVFLSLALFFVSSTASLYRLYARMTLSVFVKRACVSFYVSELTCRSPSSVCSGVCLHVCVRPSDATEPSLTSTLDRCLRLWETRP